jgi:hypothetical protein
LLLLCLFRKSGSEAVNAAYITKALARLMHFSSQKGLPDCCARTEFCKEMMPLFAIIATSLEQYKWW